MERKLALVGAVGSAGMSDHVRLLEAQGPHWDGWTHRNVLDVRAELEGQLGQDGTFMLLAYASKAQGGDGTVRWAVEVDDARFWPRKVPFSDPAHGDTYDVYAEFRYAKIRPVCLDLEALEPWEDRPLAAQRLRNTFLLVVAPDLD